MQNPIGLNTFDKESIFEVGVDDRKMLKSLEAAVPLSYREVKSSNEYSDALPQKPTATYRVTNFVGTDCAAGTLI